ncbi:MAG: bacillithiol biosynthesis deacetylase BshB1 [Sphingobacteriaceae bacterium]|nr:bacillithiol biosynthesis deacetylase BshB1 [Sphingobacteriaceae bacterium]
MKLDILAIGIHPDDVELSCAGTLLKHKALGKKIGVLDLSRGELGTRGNAELRTQEAEQAAKILNLDVRVQLNCKDGFFENNESNQLMIIEQIRKFQPEIVLCNAITDRHPDHGRSAKLVSDASFYSGLIKIKTNNDEKEQKAWRPKAIYHYIQDYYIHPDFVIDVSDFMEVKLQSILAYSSQFYNPKSNEPETAISSKHFLDTIKAKMNIWGRSIGVEYAEGFTVERYPGVNTLFDLL